MHDHPHQHGDDEQNGLWQPNRKRRNSGTRTKAANAPSQTEQRRAYDKRRVDTPVRWHMKTVVERRMPHSFRYLNANEGNDDGSTENKGKTWVPCAENVEKALDADGVEHSGQRQSEAENNT